MPPALYPVVNPGWPPPSGETRRLYLRLFGVMEAIDSTGSSVLPRSRKTRAVLAFLALAAPRPVLRTRLTGLLWSSREKEQARASLRQSLHELQEALGEAAGAILWIDRNNLAIREEAVWTDAREIVEDLASQPPAMDLLRGELLEDLDGTDPAFDHWLVGERGRLHRLLREQGENVLCAQREPDAILVGAERLLAIDPTHEGAWRAAIGAQLDRGDRVAAIALFDRYRTALAQLAGLTPSANIVALIDEIRNGTEPLVAVASIPRFMSEAPPNTPVEPKQTRRSGALRLGVMPMRLLDGLGEDPLSQGLAEEITTALSRFRWISCVASTSLSAVVGEPHDGKLWERLDLDFMLDGTIQRSAGRVRITSRLLDMRENGEVIWARRFDREMTDILALQDEIAAETVAQVDPELLLREGTRAGRRPSQPNPTAYELMLRAIPAIYRLEQTGYLAAGEMLRTAIAIDPGHAAAHAWLAYWHLFLVGQGWAVDPQDAADQGGILADRAVTLDPNDARGLTLSGHVRAFLGKRSEEGIALHQRALSLNPNLPMAWAFSGQAHCYLGQHEEAIRLISRAQQLSPFDPHGFFFEMALTMPYLLTRDHEAVLRIGRRALELNPGFSSTYKGVLAALGHLGRVADAAPLLTRLMALEPRFTLGDAISRSPILQPQDLAHYAEGLRLAGLQ